MAAGVSLCTAEQGGMLTKDRPPELIWKLAFTWGRVQ